MASLQRQTGAIMMADEQDAEVLADGGLSDYELHNRGVTFEPVKVDRKLKDKEVVTLGDVNVTLLHHPGHTRGSCSYMFDVSDGMKTYHVLIANMPTIVTNRPFREITSYTGIEKDYAFTFEAMKNL